MKTQITENDRRVMELCLREHLLDAADERVAHALSKRSPKLIASRPRPTNVGGVPSMIWLFKTTPEGRNVLKGLPAKRETKAGKGRREWAAQTKADIKAGVKCCWPGCSLRCDHGHHAEKARTQNHSRENRRPLCEKHHREAEADPKLAKKYGISKSSLGTITPTPGALPSRWSGGAA